MVVSTNNLVEKESPRDLQRDMRIGRRAVFGTTAISIGCPTKCRSFKVLQKLISLEIQLSIVSEIIVIARLELNRGRADSDEICPQRTQ